MVLNMSAIPENMLKAAYIWQLLFTQFATFVYDPAFTIKSVSQCARMTSVYQLIKEGVLVQQSLFPTTLK